MAVFSVQVKKEAFGYNWSNRYHVNSSDIIAATDDAEGSIVTQEIAIHPTYVNFTELLVSTEASGDREFVSRVLSVAGDRTFSTDRMPFFNTLLARFSVGGVGDPARKYYRIMTEGDSNGGVISDALTTLVQDALEAMIAAAASGGSPLCKTNGDLLTLVTIQAQVQERQMHRRNKKSA